MNGEATIAFVRGAWSGGSQRRRLLLGEAALLASASYRSRKARPGSSIHVALAAGVPTGEQDRVTALGFNGVSLAPRRRLGAYVEVGAAVRVVHPFWPMWGGGWGP